MTDATRRSAEEIVRRREAELAGLPPPPPPPDFEIPDLGSALAGLLGTTPRIERSEMTFCSIRGDRLECNAYQSRHGRGIEEASFGPSVPRTFPVRHIRGTDGDVMFDEKNGLMLLMRFPPKGGRAPPPVPDLAREGFVQSYSARYQFEP